MSKQRTGVPVCTPRNKCTATILQISKRKKNTQLQAAIDYCKANSCRGQKAISAKVCPLIKDPKTINRMLDSGREVGKQKEYCKCNFTAKGMESEKKMNKI